MKDLKELINMNILESKNNTVEDYQRYANGLKKYFDSKDDLSKMITGKALKKCAGYIIESLVKFNIQFDQFRPEDWDNAPKDEEGFSKIESVYDDGENWYDFSMRGDKFEIKSFEKGKKYSNTKLTKAQAEHKDELTFVLCEYTINNDKLKVTNIEIVEGKDLKINGNRLVKK